MSHFHTIKKDRDDDPNVVDERVVEVFTFKGTEDYTNSDGYPMLEPDEDVDIFTLADAYAVRITGGRRTRFYVKRGKYGKLFNPIGMYSEGQQRKQHRHAGKPAWKFKETSQKIFTYYIKFLRSKNPAWLNNAEREV